MSWAYLLIIPALMGASVPLAFRFRQWRLRRQGVWELPGRGPVRIRVIIGDQLFFTEETTGNSYGCSKEQFYTDAKRVK